MNESDRWYSQEDGFFNPDYLDEFDFLYDPARVKTEVDFVDRALGRDRSLQILDLACGNGRHTVELAKRGYKVTGLDLNGFFLERAKKAAQEAGVSAEWIHADMREIPLDTKMDAVLSLFTSFGYLETDDDDQKVLNRIGQVLRQHGLLVMDMINREWIMRNYQEFDWRKMSGRAILLMQRWFDLMTGKNHELRTRISPDGSRREVSVIVRMYTIIELVKMLEQAGLHIEAINGGYSDEPPTIDSKFTVIRARRV